MDFSGIILFLKILGFLLSLAFLVGIVVSWLGAKDVDQLNEIKEHQHFLTTHDIETPEEKRWQAITEHFQSDNPVEWRMAIIDADAMLEDLVTAIGYRGETFGEKLKSIEASDFPHLNNAWYVHKLRNNLAHQGTAYHLSEREAYQAFKIYNAIFHETGYLS